MGVDHSVQCKITNTEIQQTISQQTQSCGKIGLHLSNAIMYKNKYIINDNENKKFLNQYFPATVLQYLYKQ